MSALDGKPYRNGEILGGVQIEMKAKGYNKTVDQIRAKWKALKHVYKDKEYCNSKRGNYRKDASEWDEELNELLKTRPSVKPLEYGIDSIKSDNEVQEGMEATFANDILHIDYNNTAETSSTLEDPEISTEIINSVQTSKTQKKSTTKKYKIEHKKNDLCENSTSCPAYTGKVVYKSLLEVSSKRLKRTDLLTKYEEDILKTKLETAFINKETAMVELNIAKQKLVTEQYIYESLKQNTDKS